MSSSNNIFAPRGLSSHPFKAGESSKDSSGMGGGGMYFGQQHQDSQEEQPEIQELEIAPFDVALEEMDSNLFSMTKPAEPRMKIWKTLVAGQIYKDIHKIKPIEHETPA